MQTSPLIAKNRRLSVLLLGFFLICFLSIAAIDMVFHEISEELAKQLSDQRVRLSVSEQIASNIVKIESSLFQMTSAGNSAGYRRSLAQAAEATDLLDHHIHVLQNGGQVRRILNVNVLGIEQFENTVSYKPNPKIDGATIEVIELLPFVDRIRAKSQTLVTLLERRDQCIEARSPCAEESMAAVRSYYKELSPFFYRLTENTNRQLMEGLIRLDELQKALQDKESKLKSLHITAILLVIIFGTALSAFFLRRINAAQTQAEIARDKAEEASLAKTRFLATMSHEIRTPMNGILGMVQILEDGELTPMQRRDNLRVIRDSGNTLMQLLNDILDLAKVEAGKMRLRIVPTSPSQLVSETAALFMDMARAKGVDISTSSGVASPFRYSMDGDRVRQMIGNLVSNAIKFTESGEVRVHVSMVTESGMPNMLEFSVEDTGVGILAENQDSLFKRFTQLDDSSTRRYDGSGLGLFIVHQFAQMMGGAVGFESTMGKGSRFWFRILATEVTVANLVSSTEVRTSVETFKNSLVGHVLIAEDNPTSRVILKTMLNRMGLTTRLVEDGQAAFEVYTSSEEFDGVLMDISMPRMNGLESTRLIRDWERNNEQPRCPIIAITANAYSEDRDACLDAGMDDFIVKPIMVERLSASLTKYLGQGVTRPAAAIPSAND